MKMITAIIRPEKLDDVKAALFAAQVEGLTITRVSGHGGEKTVLESYRGHPLVYEFHDKVRLDIGVSEPFVDVTIAAIVKAGKTGQVGDGKIFVMPIEKVVRIRRSEEHTSELQSLRHLVCRLLLEKKKTDMQTNLGRA